MASVLIASKWCLQEFPGFGTDTGVWSAMYAVNAVKTLASGLFKESLSQMMPRGASLHKQKTCMCVKSVGMMFLRVRQRGIVLDLVRRGNKTPLGKGLMQEYPSGLPYQAQMAQNHNHRQVYLSSPKMAWKGKKRWNQDGGSSASWGDVSSTDDGWSTKSSSDWGDTDSEATSVGKNYEEQYKAYKESQANNHAKGFCSSNALANHVG